MGAVAVRVLLLVGVWVVLGRAVGLAVGQTPDATITASVATTTAWFAVAGFVALLDARRDRLPRYPLVLWVVVCMLTSVACVTWQWASAALSAHLWVGSDLLDDLGYLTPGLLVGSTVCAMIGLALGRRDAAAARAVALPESREATEDQRPLTRSATRANHEVVDAAGESSRRSAVR
ncbi:hypothetical protein CLV56_2065 [Mumia flava]|uniref:Uncharacterized protein n=1 Tax=Mumia flava TaxID=1348852 RepID=A0A0B2B297_9ACTN|nr:hypothetical protein CLV56_2065 [Mumia flava]